MTRRLAAVLGLALAVVILTPTTASAHPLGNFTVNHFHGLAFDSDGLTDSAVIDSAEIPTKQAENDVDANGDGTADPSERSTYATAQCAALAKGTDFAADGDAVALQVVSSSFTYSEGQAALPVSRLECELRGDVQLDRAMDVSFSDRSDFGRVGWREMTATGDGVHLDESPVPADSITNRLESYPNDLLSSPLDVREVTIRVLPGSGASTVADSIDTTSQAGPLTRLIDRVTGTFNDLVGRDHLTVQVGLLAMALALLLGASHAVLPGHGKTVMAAYIAGRQGSVRDAVVVGATVTATHTTGVIVLGLALTLSSSLAGDEVLRWLGALSGLLVASLGVGLLVNAIRHKTNGHGHTHSHGFGRHVHAHEPHGHTHDDHAYEPVVSDPERQRVLVLAGDPGSAAHTTVVRAHTHDHDHDAHDAHDAHDHGHDAHSHAHDAHSHDHSGHTHDGHTHNHEGHGHGPEERVLSRRGLVAMGVAGGLVPSPSALVVLLAAIALGRTIFGVALVLCYGIGMAATLTAVGLILVKLRDRYQGHAAERFSRRFAARWTRFIPYTTGAIVVAVGLLLTTRSLLGTV